VGVLEVDVFDVLALFEGLLFNDELEALFDADEFNFGDIDLTLFDVVDDDDASDDAVVIVEDLFFSADNTLVLELELAGGDLSCDDITDLVLVLVEDVLFKFGLIGAFFFRFGTILGVVVVVKFLNGLVNAKAGFIAAIKACIFARAAVLGKILGCLFNDGRVPNGNTDDKSNGFISNCEIAGILFKFGKADVFNGRLVDIEDDGIVDFKFKEGFIGKGILLFNDDPNLFKFDANIELVVLFDVPTGNEFDNGNNEGTEDDTGAVDVVVFLTSFLS